MRAIKQNNRTHGVLLQYSISCYLYLGYVTASC